jgi:hypothetical protein
MGVDDWARVVWDYHHVHHALAKADCIIVLGSHDTRVAERGAEVFLAGWAPLVVCSGHLGGLTSGMWNRSEAEIFADVAAGLGVPRERILIESRSTNTGENVDFSRQLLKQRGTAGDPAAAPSGCLARDAGRGAVCPAGRPVGVQDGGPSAVLRPSRLTPM